MEFPTVPLFRRILAGIVLATAATLSGCAGSGGPVMTNQVVVDFPADMQGEYAAVRNDVYRLRPGDKLAVRFLYNEELEQPEILVLSDGTASFFGLDSAVRVTGLSVTELDSVLTDQYARKFRDPDLNVIVIKAAEKMVYVLGEVRDPGLFQVPDVGANVLGAVALAGGLTGYADRGHVVLIRVTPEGYLCRQMNVGHFQDGKVFDPVLYDLEPYDILYVGRSWLGDFAQFSKDLVGSLQTYTGVAADLVLIDNQGSLYRR